MPFPALLDASSALAITVLVLIDTYSHVYLQLGGWSQLPMMLTFCAAGAGQNVASREHVVALLEQGRQSPVAAIAQACSAALGMLQSQKSIRTGEMHTIQ